MFFSGNSFSQGIVTEVTTFLGVNSAINYAVRMGELKTNKIDDDLSPRYIFIKKKDGTIEYHPIDKFEKPDIFDDKKTKKRLVLSTSSICVDIYDYPYGKIQQAHKKFGNRYDLFGVVIDEAHLEKPVSGKCQRLKFKYSYIDGKHMHGHDRLLQNGLSKVLTEQLERQGKLTQENLKDILGSSSSYLNVSPYPFVCKEISHLHKLLKILVNTGYMDTQFDKKASYFYSGAKLAPTKQMLDLEEYLKSEQEKRGEQIANKIAGIETGTKGVTTTALLGYHLTRPGKFAKYLKGAKVVGKWVVREIPLIALIELGLLNMSGSGIHKQDDLIADNPRLLIAALSEEDQKDACRRIANNPKALEATHGLLNELWDNLRYAADGEEWVEAHINSHRVMNDQRFDHRKDLELFKTEEEEEVSFSK